MCLTSMMILQKVTKKGRSEMKNFKTIVSRLVLSTFIFIGVQSFVLPTTVQAARACRVVFANENGEVKL